MGGSIFVRDNRGSGEAMRSISRVAEIKPFGEVAACVDTWWPKR